jgi:hypothetical protein
MVINLISGVKMPFPENLRNNVARTERVQLDTNGSTAACLRLDDKVRWRSSHPLFRVGVSGSNKCHSDYGEQE